MINSAQFHHHIYNLRQNTLSLEFAMKHKFQKHVKIKGNIFSPKSPWEPDPESRKNNKLITTFLPLA